MGRTRQPQAFGLESAAPAPRVLHVVTSDVSVGLMRGQPEFLRGMGFEIVIAASPGRGLDRALREGARVVPVAMEREIAPLHDLVSLWCLWRRIRHVRPAITNVGTAKAGLLGGLAAWLAGVPCRTYTLRGLRLETTTGLKRWILTLCERVACRCAHRVICVSGSLRQRAIELRLVDAGKAIVLGNGSSNGVDAARLEPTDERRAQAAAIRRELGIPEDAPVVGFVGRFTRDKGVPELVEAFSLLRKRFPQVRLMVLGKFESGDPVADSVRRMIVSDPGIVWPGFVDDTSPYYHVMDVLALPTYREGFPNAPLEAAAAGKPVVTTRATGAVDSVVDGVTGMLVPAGDARALAETLGYLLANPEMAARMGRAGRERVEREFRPERIWQALAALYCELLQERRLPVPRARRLLLTARSNSRCRSRSHAAQRLMDVVGAVTGLVLTAPAMAAAAHLIRFTMGPPVLFRQERAGQYGKAFCLLKFRTMTDDRDAEGRLLPDAKRLTPLGKLLRRVSIDELPQLWNVLRGEMSMVGPRPLLMEYLGRYSPRQLRRHEVKPGITGWAQIHGRNAVTWEQKFELDLWYVENRSLLLDLRILLATVLKVATREGISQPGQATSEEFTGSPMSVSRSAIGREQ